MSTTNPSNKKKLTLPVIAGVIVSGIAGGLALSTIFLKFIA